MLYKINHFTYDDSNGIIRKQNDEVQLTKTQRKLFNYFIENPKTTISKETLMDEVWDRVVTMNSIERTLSILRANIEENPSEPKLLITHFGHGISFDATIEPINNTDSSSLKTKSFSVKAYGIITMLCTIVVLSFMLFKQTTNSKENTILLFLSDSSADKKADWLHQSSLAFIDQFFGYMKNTKVKDISDKPRYLNQQQYINNQFELSPKLKVVTTSLSQEKDVYTLTLTMSGKEGNKQTQTFTNDNLSAAIKASSQWLASRANIKESFDDINSLIPDDSFVVEMYMRGLASSNQREFEKAEYSYKLCLKEKPDFYLARLELARINMIQGKLDKTLSILDTLSTTSAYPELAIEIESLRGDVYDTQGKYEKARDLFLQVLADYPHNKSPQINKIRYNLSHTFITLTQYDKALEQLNWIEKNSTLAEDASFLATVLQKKANIYLTLGQVDEAQEFADRALKLYSKLEDLLGEAKTYSVLSRIASHQSKYKEAINYLEQSLQITRTVDFKIGIGATLNDMIYLLMVQGKFNKAWQANQEMQKIALDIDYKQMLQISKQFSVDITRAQKKWVKSEMYLKEHLELAKESNNKRALLKNWMLSLELFLDEGKLEPIEDIIKQVQNYIDETKELRLQPRLNKLKGRYYFQTQQAKKALNLLKQSKKLALDTKDGETIVEINNLLAEYYIKNNDIEKALQLLEESELYNPLPYPYLLLKSKANAKLGNHLIALDLANECKLTANEFWQQYDEYYLSKLRTSA